MSTFPSSSDPSSSSTDPERSSLSQVLTYHNQTKHSSDYDRGPRGLDCEDSLWLGYEELKKLIGLHIDKEFPIISGPVRGKIPDIESEHPECVLAMFPSGSRELRVDYGEVSTVIAEFQKLEWKGKPNVLSKEHVCWYVIHRTAEAVEKPLVKTDEFLIDPFVSSGSLSDKSCKGFAIWEVVRKRRSTVDMDEMMTMDRNTIYQILLHCLPSGSVNEGKQMKPITLPFRDLSWDAQDIAGDGCFGLGTIAHLETTLLEKGPWMYPRLFWETGVLGQVLYPEAHAVGISAIGIGCFFDDLICKASF